jgi:hypothetical protein
MKVMTAGGAGSGGMKKTTATTTRTTNAEDDGIAGDAITKEGPFPAFATKAEHSPDKQIGGPFGGLEIEDHNTEQQQDVEEIPLNDHDEAADRRRADMAAPPIPYSDDPQQSSSLNASLKPPSSATDATSKANQLYHEFLWLVACFVGIMLSFVGYGLLLEYTTSGGRQLHEMSFLFVTSALYTVTAAVGRYVRDETPSTIPPAQFALLGLTSMGSTFCSVRSLRYVIAYLLLLLLDIVVVVVVVGVVVDRTGNGDLVTGCVCSFIFLSRSRNNNQYILLRYHVSTQIRHFPHSSTGQGSLFFAGTILMCCC